MQVKKRDNSIVNFQIEKIKNAIQNAAKSANEQITPQKLGHVVNKIVTSLSMLDKEVLDIEEIQDIVEHILLASTLKQTAREYVIYREQRRQNREFFKQDNMTLVENYLSEADWRVKENSSIIYSIQGLNLHISGEVSKNYWLNRIYPVEVKQAHESGAMHIHDLSMISTYCNGWDLKDLLLEGFTGVPGKTASDPAKHFRTVLLHVVNFLFSLQSCSAGAVAFSNFDTLLAPFIRYDKLTYEEVKQSIQEFIFNMNIATRTGAQSPFTNLTFDLQPPKHLGNEAVIIGGQLKEETYSEFQQEMNWINQSFLEVMAQGDSCGRPFTFPIPTYNITKDFNWDNPELDILWQVTAKYGIPTFSNYVNSQLDPADIRSMCCRLKIRSDILQKRAGGMFGAGSLTGSIGVVTINIPQITYLSKNKEDFFKRLEHLMHLSKVSLEIKRKTIEELADKDFYPYSKFYLRNIKTRFSKYYQNHFSTIGLIGMNEACISMFNKDIGSQEGQDFTKEVLNFMNAKALEFQKETGNFYNIEATPGEGTSHRLARLDYKKYSKQAIVNGAENNWYYTNSTALPTNYTSNPFKALELQDEILAKYTGGSTLHFYLGEALIDPQAIKKFIRKVCENYTLPYFTISPTFSVCQNHGYINGNKEYCPECKEKTEVYSRVVGYIRPVSQWNNGKREEFKDRENFKIEE